MTKKRVIAVAAVVLLLGITAVAVSAMGNSDLARVKAATAQFHQPEVAQAAGWDLVPGLDHCFDNAAGAMGYHYINTGILADTIVDPLAPEAMVYAPKENGKLKLAAVEYIVPQELWDTANPGGSLPSLFGQDFHLNAGLGVYVLHAWIWQNNPSGIFEDWNPNVSCP